MTQRISDVKLKQQYGVQRGAASWQIASVLTTFSAYVRQDHHSAAVNGDRPSTPRSPAGRGQLSSTCLQATSNRNSFVYSYKPKNLTRRKFRGKNSVLRGADLYERSFSAAVPCPQHSTALHGANRVRSFFVISASPKAIAEEGES